MLTTYPLNDPQHGPTRERAAAASGGGGTTGAVTNTLPDFMQTQTQSNWCWSACGTSVGLFFETGMWTQCNTACGCLNRTDCCNTPCPTACNVYGYLDQALTFTKSYSKKVVGTITAAKIQAQINTGLPVGVRVAWVTGGAHFLMITGYSYPSASPSQLTIYLQDSIWGASSMLLSDFPARYHAGGSWTHTYYTAKPV